MKVDINLCYKDRPTEMGLLLTSLRTQTHQDYDIFISDDGSSTPIQGYHFLNCLINRLKLEGHRVVLLRNDRSLGIARNRQGLVDYTLEHGSGDGICRIDDDCIVDPDYLEKLVQVIDEGYDIASGVTPPMLGTHIAREVKYVEPIINRVVLDGEGNFVINGDDCGSSYIDSVVLPTHHFRSSALIKKDVHRKVSYEDTLTPCGFREEEFFSFRAILSGFSIGVHTGAFAWHLMAPSGGDRRQNYAELSVQNQRLLNRFVKRNFKKHGDFIEAYNKSLGVRDSDEKKFKSLNKASNLIYSREE